MSLHKRANYFFQLKFLSKLLSLLKWLLLIAAIAALGLLVAAAVVGGSAAVVTGVFALGCFIGGNPLSWSAAAVLFTVLLPVSAVAAVVAVGASSSRLGFFSGGTPFGIGEHIAYNVLGL